MPKSQDSDDTGKKPKAGARGDRVAGGSPAEAATLPTDAPARSAGPTRRQVRQIARLVGRLEALGELEAKRRRQLQVALEKGGKTKRHRQQVDRAVGRVGELIDRLRTLARELESPVPSATPVRSAARNSAPKTRNAVAAPATAREAKPAAARTLAKPAARPNRSKPASAGHRPEVSPE